MSWDLAVYDTQKGAFWGAEREFYADSQLDNLASCHAALQALLVMPDGWMPRKYARCSTMKKSAVKAIKALTAVSCPNAGQHSFGDSNRQRGLCQGAAKSFMISADMAHAYQPNFPNAYDPGHKVIVNKGPVIKVNANHNYSSESVSAAMFVDWCEQAGVPYQTYSHRCDLPCGSTIGPITSAKLGIRSIDVGNPMWAMHSLRESAGVLDHEYMIRVMKRFFATP